MISSPVGILCTLTQLSLFMLLSTESLAEHIMAGTFYLFSLTPSFWVSSTPKFENVISSKIKTVKPGNFVTGGVTLALCVVS